MNRVRSRPRVLLIHTGGTFGMGPARAGFVADLRERVPELGRVARIRAVTPFVIDSASAGPRHWLELASLLFRAMRRWDGFVITHGTDTLTYTAAALSFLLPGLRKPVVLTGAQRPLSAARTDARGNLLDAVEVAGSGIPEVAIVFGGLVLRGNRARKRSLSDYRAFESPNHPPLGEIGTSLVLRPERLLKPVGRPRLRSELDPRVRHWRLVPGMDGEDFRRVDPARVRGLVLEAFGAGNLPVGEGLVPEAVRELRGRGVVVVMAGGSEHGAADLALYEGGRAARAAGAISGGDLLPGAAVVKLMVALGRERRPEAVERIFQVPWAGEMARPIAR
jgi:L-asparaginase